ncbi:hypothetical protein J0I05_04735 [Candidatus Saccharibacteria bacterium]|nr:hypothetical protein [Candidatus Saccharibacteria bacterium]
MIHSVIHTKKVSYTPFGVDIAIKNLFPKNYNGTYIEVGSNLPFTHSLTKNLFINGWKGVHVNPDGPVNKMVEFDRKNNAEFFSSIKDFKEWLTNQHKLTVDVVSVGDNDSSYYTTIIDVLKSHTPRIIVLKGIGNTISGYEKTHIYDQYTIYQKGPKTSNVLEIGDGDIIESDLRNFVWLDEQNAKRTNYTSQERHAPSIISFKENAKHALQELIYLAGKSDADKVVHSPEGTIKPATSIDDVIDRVIIQSGEYYKKSSLSYYEQSSYRPPKHIRVINKLSLLGIKVPKLLFNEGVRVVRRRLSR